MMAGLVMWFGGNAERLAAGAILAGWLVTLSAHVVVEPLARASVSPIILVAESLGCALLVVLARDESRPWMMAAAAFFVAVVLTQVISLLNPNVLSIGYVVAQTAASFGIMASLVYGAYRVHAARRAR